MLVVDTRCRYSRNQWASRYYPAKKTRLTFTLSNDKERWRVTRYHPLMPQAQAAKYRDRPFYLVIAGCFRKKARAERHAERVLERSSRLAQVEQSSDFANLRPGWFIVVPSGGLCWSIQEARALVQELR